MRTAEGEYFIPADKMNGAFDGDLVEVAPVRQERSRKALAQAASSTRRREARVKRVVEHAHQEIIGRYEIAGPFGVVVPEDPRIAYDVFTQLGVGETAPEGAIVRVAIDTYPSRKEAATGHVVEVLGDADDERVPIDLIVARHKLETSFSQGALDEAADARVDMEGAFALGYRDLRERFVFTIDPADARDYDDAVSISSVVLANDGTLCWRVGVHIADVSHYVPWSSSVDLDARRRATSVYLVDRVIPMLPEALSNEICSLKPGEDRLSMTVDLLIDAQGSVVSADVYPAVIRSRARLTYEQAQEFIDYAAATGELTAENDLEEQLAWRIRKLSDLAKKRMELRAAAGGIDFDTVEARVRLDADGAPASLELRRRTDATQLIEEAMIAANEAVARYLRDAGFPCIYRTHDKPSRESLAGLVPVLQEFSWFSEVNVDAFVAGNPRAIARVLSACAGRSEEALITSLVLRSMKRALYEPELDVHYALASDAYVHFTSPIRRYPDLVVHRMLKAAQMGRPQKFDQEVANLPWIAEHSSEMERIAEKAARESQEVKIVELMETRIGQTFSGMIAGVASWGLVVRLDNTAEGVVEIEDLGREYFVLDSVKYTLTGSDTGKQYRLGKRVAVCLVEADRRSRTLKFRLVKRA